MIFRPLNIAGFLAAALAGLHLYSTKHEAALLDRELRTIARDIDAANERTQALQAEWAWLNEPERLRAVAQRHLSLEPMQPTQFLRLNEAERRMPAVLAFDGPPALFAARPQDVPEGESVAVALLPRLSPPVQIARTEPAAPVPAPAPAPSAEAPEDAPLATLPPPPAAP
ncbi:hypothetical protein JYK14_25055, partial [Siccirubricoccus sp. KC 17139]|nr:hypothetical protein [Siccirubricoccus soli]MCP2685540.1 hypothetical protein [Siccirubricoccus soli]